MATFKASEILMGREIANPLTSELKDNLNRLLIALNKFGLVAPFIHLSISSGYRPPAINAATPGAAKHSTHMICLAADIHDASGEVDAWCIAHPEVLAECGLWQEDPASTPGWCHLQAIPPASGKRVFKP